MLGNSMDYERTYERLTRLARVRRLQKAHPGTFAVRRLPTLEVRLWGRSYSTLAIMGRN